MDKILLFHFMNIQINVWTSISEEIKCAAKTEQNKEFME